MITSQHQRFYLTAMRTHATSLIRELCMKRYRCSSSIIGRVTHRREIKGGRNAHEIGCCFHCGYHLGCMPYGPGRWTPTLHALWSTAGTMRPDDGLCPFSLLGRCAAARTLRRSYRVAVSCGGESSRREPCRPLWTASMCSRAQLSSSDLCPTELPPRRTSVRTTGRISLRPSCGSHERNTRG